MTTATRLSIYQGACAVIGERQLLTTTENRESRRALDDVWDRGGIGTCLANGLWNFAARSIQWDFDPSFAPSWGFQCVFEIPSDWVRWMKVCADPYFNQPLLQCTTEGQHFYTDLQRLWVKYVSNDPKFGMNMAGWPDNFQRYVEAYFGEAICMRVTGDENKRKDAEIKRDGFLQRAKSTDAMAESTALLPAGNWSMSRHGRRGSIERGNPSRLIG
ncbi:MAG TPA: hypothetical protein VFX20_18110 [Steroidobacteraceae bacterium]|nr:hypothetical protein [Steroidobacteraceae bacterium]